MRTLLYVPIVHPLCDMGLRGTRYVLGLEQSIGTDRTAEHLTALEEFWKDLPPLVLEHLECSGVPFKRIHVFADSLPRGMHGNPDSYVNEWLAKFNAIGSPMAACITDLQRRGATLHGTEDEALVFAHSEHLNAPPSDDAGRYEIHRRYVNLRDACVAMQVNRTVPNGHLALLFMGALHNVDELLEQTGTFNIERIDLLDTNLLPLAR